MVDRVPQLSATDVCRLLQAHGFVLRRTTGSHHVFRHPNDKRIVVVPLHAKGLKRPLLLSILKQAGLKRDEL